MKQRLVRILAGACVILGIATCINVNVIPMKHFSAYAAEATKSEATPGEATASEKPAPAPYVSKKNVTVKKGGTNIKKETVNTTKSGKASVTSVESSADAKIVKLKKTVEYNGKEYTVTAVNANAFKKCRNITRIVLPNSVTKIRANAFRGATSLKTVDINVKKAISVERNAFKGLDTKKMTIRVSKSMSNSQLNKLKKTLKAAGFKGKVQKKL